MSEPAPKAPEPVAGAPAPGDADWMQRLAARYAAERRRHPGARLMIVFDIDGTILDMRYLILRLLREWDRTRGASWFADLALGDIDVHEDHVDHLLGRMGVPAEVQPDIQAYFDARRWEPEALVAAHRPFQGVLEVIRWFELQPDTYVGLNTARNEAKRERTLRALDALGAHWKVRFASERLVMNPGGFGPRVLDAKARGIRTLRERGYHPFAFVDNEPANLAKVAAEEPELLLLHADTIFASQRHALPATAVSGTRYDLAPLAPSGRIPERVELVWRAVNDRARLDRFLASPVRWAEADVRRDPALGRPVLQHAPIEEEVAPARRPVLALDELLDAVDGSDRCVKLDLKEAGPLPGDVLAAVARHGLADERLRFNARLETLGEAGFRELRERHPGALLQCPVDFLAPLHAALPGRAREIAGELRRWGIDRFGLAWDAPGFGALADALLEAGHELNVYAVDDLETFLRAALLLPRSITASLDSGAWTPLLAAGASVAP